MSPEEAKAIKIAVKYLNEDPNGQELVKYMEDIAGKFAPQYDRTNSTSVILAAGRTEMMQTLRNINRLTTEQFLELSEG